jgi:hypothetical protein
MAIAGASFVISVFGVFVIFIRVLIPVSCPVSGFMHEPNRESLNRVFVTLHLGVSLKGATHSNFD